MESARFYCSSIKQPVTELIGTETHHLKDVLRFSVGDKIQLFDGQGALAIGAIKEFVGRKVSVQVQDLKVLPRPSRPDVVIAVSTAKGQRFDWLIAKCTELGVDRIITVLFERTVRQAKSPKSTERWRNIAISACKQCGRLFLPQIDTPVTLQNAIETLEKDYEESEFLFGSLSADALALASRPATKTSTVAFIGPEGGLSEKEETLLQGCGARPVRLTDTILRIETAAVAFAAILAVQRTAAQRL